MSEQTEAVGTLRERARAAFETAERERLAEHYAKSALQLQRNIRRVLGIDVEVRTDEVLLDSITFTADGDSLRILDHCPRCQQMVVGDILIMELQDLGQVLSEPFKPQWDHVRECPPAQQPAAERLVDVLREILAGALE